MPRRTIEGTLAPTNGDRCIAGYLTANMECRGCTHEGDPSCHKNKPPVFAGIASAEKLPEHVTANHRVRTGPKTSD